MISHEQQAEMLVEPKSKESGNIQTSTNTTSDNLTNLRTATRAQLHQQQQPASQLLKKKQQSNKLDAAVVLNVKCHCNVENSYCISSNSFGFCHHHCMDSEYLSTKFSLLSNPISAGGADKSESTEKQLYLADRKRYWPPPIFIIFISLLEIFVFMYDFVTAGPRTDLNNISVLSESLLIYRPDRRLQIWRFVTYMLMHVSWFHLVFNVIVQLLYGLPLEMAHGSVRIAAIYLAGVLAGSLGTSVIDSEVYLVGASGGVYALLAAQFSHILIYFGQLRYGIYQLLAVLIFVFCDTGYALYSKFVVVDSIDIIPSVSYIAHLSGSLAGFTIRILVLTNREDKTESNSIRWLAFGFYTSFILFAVAFNLINSVIAQRLEEEGENIRQHLFHDLRIS